MELVAVHQQNAGLNTAKLHRNPVNDGVKKFVEFKDGADMLCCFLHRYQDVHAALLENCRVWTKRRMAGSAWHGKGLLVPSIRFAGRFPDAKCDKNGTNAVASETGSQPESELPLAKPGLDRGTRFC
jgi:hypothetical protein